MLTEKNRSGILAKLSAREDNTQRPEGPGVETEIRKDEGQQSWPIQIESSRKVGQGPIGPKPQLDLEK